MDLIKALIVFGAEVEIHNDLGETPGLIAARTSKGQTETGLCVCVCAKALAESNTKHCFYFIKH